MKTIKAVFAALLLTILLPVQAAAVESGLMATYYDNMDFTGKSLSRIDPTINYYNIQAPDPSMGAEFWSAIWTGAITIPKSETYKFTTNSDDGIELIIDGIQVIRNWTGHGPTLDSGSLFLDQGDHQVEIRFYNSHNTATLQLYWESTGIAKAIIPTNVLKPVVPPSTIGRGTGLTGNYYESHDFSKYAFNRVDDSLDFSWGESGPGNQISGKFFSVVWRGWIEPQYSQTYTFYVEANDSIEMYVEGQRVVGNIDYTAIGEKTGTRYMVAGKKYEIAIKYRQIGGSASARVLWSCPLTAKQVIPKTQLYPMEVANLGDIRFVTSGETYVSPAWMELTSATSSVSISASVGGRSLNTVRMDRSRVYVSDSDRQGPLGIALLPGDNPVDLVIQTEAGSKSLHDTLSWIPYDLSNPPYGDTGMIGIRVGDTLLVTASNGDANTVITVEKMDGTQVGSHNSPSGQLIQLPFISPGQYRVQQVKDGVSVGSVGVAVYGTDIKAPIACEVGFQRQKAIDITGPLAVDRLWIGSSDPANLEVATQTLSSPTTQLLVRALSLTKAQLQVRIGDGNGPLLQGVIVDPFIMRVDSEISIKVVVKYPDGSELTEGQFTMIPHVRDLDMTMNIFTGGAQFSTGGINFSMSTNAFVPGDGFATYKYYIVRSGKAGSALCHHTTIYQGNDIVGRH